MKKAFLIFIGCYFVSSFCFGQVHTWTGNGDNYFWSDADNWDQGTIPLIDGVGTVIIPTGAEVHSTSTINFEYGEFTGGGTLFNNGAMNLINSDEVLTSKIFSNISILSSTYINVFRADGILNTDPILINEGAIIYSGYASGIGLFNLNGIGISFNSLQPGILFISSDFTKTGIEDVIIDVEMNICCYDFTVAEGTLIIEPYTVNNVFGPYFDIPQGASLFLKGNTIFNGSGGSVTGNIQGLLEITNGLAANPSILGSFFFDAEGEIILNNVTFQGSGTFYSRVNVFIPENTTATIDGPRFSNQRTLYAGHNSTILLNGETRLSNSSNGEMILNECVIEGNNNQRITNGGFITINNNSNVFVDNVSFENYNVLNIGNGSFIMGDNSELDNYYYFDPEFPEWEEYGKIIGSGNFRFPTYNSQTVKNNGMFSPELGITTMHTENFSQTDTGFIEIEINDLNSFDKIENIGATNFEGGFKIELNFQPSIGDEFIVYQSDSSITSCSPISTITANYNNYDYVFDVICNTNNITLRLTEILGMDSFSNNGVSFYPNPTSEVVNYNISKDIIFDNNNMIVILNGLGEILKKVYIDKPLGNINIDDLSSGLYIIKLITDKKIVSVSKLIIE